MCTRFPRFVATLLLFGILLQRCGNPHWKIADGESSGDAGANMYNPAKVKKCSKSPKLATTDSFTKGSMEPKVGYPPVLGDASSGACSTELLSEVANTPTPVAIHGSVRVATPPLTPTSRLFYAPGSSIQTKVSRKHAAPKTHSGVLDQASMAMRVYCEHDQALVLATPSSLQATLATGLLDTSWSNANPRRQPQLHPEAKHALKATERKESSIKPTTNLAFQAYPSSQGHQVCFQEADGKWFAQVQDGWGREQLLPVVCANLQNPKKAIQSLSSKAPGQHKYWVHVLETNQLPWAPRCVYVGRLGIRGGMEKEARHVQERINTMHASRDVNHVTVSGQSLQLHETADEESDHEDRQKARRKRLSERRRQKILANSATRLASIRNTHTVNHDQQEDAKSDRKEEETQALLPNEAPIATWHPPFAAKAAPTPANWLQHNLPLYAPSASEGSWLAQTQAAHEQVANAQKEVDTKMPSLSRATTFTTPAAAQKAVEAYLKRWKLAIPSGRAALQEQGEDILKAVEMLKKKTKHSYRQQVLGFETCDIDPLVWNIVLQQQQTAKKQLNALRDLRTQLLDVCQLQGEALQVAGIRITTNAATGEVDLCSSDEETQQLSDQSRRNHAAFVAGIGKALQGHIEELLALVDDAMGTQIVHYIALLSSIPKLPDLLGDYVEEFLHEADEERRAELLGSLLTEVILQFFPLPKGNKSQLNGIKHTLGKAAQKVTSQRTDQLNTRVRKGKAPERISRFGQKK